MNISATVLTHNSQNTIERCLQSVSWCNEIIVLDDASSDNTCEIAKRFGAHVVHHELQNDFSKQHQCAMEEAKNDWILSIDSDEVVSPELRQSISHIHEQESTYAYRIKRQDHFWGIILRHGETAQVRNQGIIRLFRKSKAQWVGAVHETVRIEHVGETLTGYIDHFPHQTVSEFIGEINRYSTLRAHELFKQRKKPTLFSLLAYPWFKFTYTFLVKLGFLDGPAGFAYAFLMSFHSFLVRAKLYQYWLIPRHDK